MATIYTHQVDNFKKRRILMSIFVMSVLFFGLFFVFNTASAESIKEFNSTITVNVDSSILVEESITYDFEGAEKHGIFRIISLKNSQNNSIEINNISVLGDNGIRYSFTENILNDELTIKIGDADKLISGVKEYNISYKVLGAIGYYEDHDEIYWNVTGNNWIVPIKKVQTRVILPAGITSENLQNSCYVGIYGSNSTCQINIKNDGVYFIYENILNQGEGMTVATGLSKGIFFAPTKFQRIISIILNNIIVLLPIIVFIIMFLIWNKYGKDPKGYSTIIAQYEPPVGMKPTLVGSLVDEKADFRDITAGIIYLAEQGFIKIKKLEKSWVLGYCNYEFELLKNDDASLDQVEKDILNTLFDYKLIIGSIVKISDFKLSNEFAWRIKDILSSLYQEMKNRGYFVNNPKTTKTLYVSGSLVFMFLGIFLSAKMSWFLGMGMIIISGIIVIIFGLLMGKKTKLGAETKEYILGFKLFLSITDKDRLNFHNAPGKNPEKFMEFLPYAIALGVEKKWAKQFEGIYLPQPTWYSGSTSGTFIITDFTSEISGLSQSFSSISGVSGSSSGGSGGGGSSGGGGGGGGGGSW